MSKIAIVQFKASTDKTKNLPRILQYIKQAAKNHADLCAFPEYMMFFTPASQSANKLHNKLRQSTVILYQPYQNEQSKIQSL